MLHSLSRSGYCATLFHLNMASLEGIKIDAVLQRRKEGMSVEEKKGDAAKAELKVIDHVKS